MKRRMRQLARRMPYAMARQLIISQRLLFVA
jgi:hypothetical protein